MTGKRWLIRTRSKQILGPASKEKIVSLIEKESLHDEDELSSGNGYWFWVKEKDLVEKYLYANEPQGFNPVTECQSVLNTDQETPVEVKEEIRLEVPAPEINKNVFKKEIEELVMPNDEDLEFPDIDLIAENEEGALDHTSVITLDQLSNKQVKQAGEELSYANEETTDESTDEHSEITDELKSLVEKKSKSKDINTQKKKINEKSNKVISSVDPQDDTIESNGKNDKKNRNDRYLFLLLAFICLLLFSVFYYYRTIINKPIPIIGISNVNAQSLTSLVKKKAQLS